MLQIETFINKGILLYVFQEEIKMEIKLKTKGKEIDVKDLTGIYSLGFKIYASSILDQKELFKISIHEINRYWDTHNLWIENEETKEKYWLAKNLWQDIEEENTELNSAIQDYIESCNRQGIDFYDSVEKKRFISENSHLGVTLSDLDKILN